MAVLNAQYKQPSSAYSQGLKDLIDAMLQVNPKDRPDIHKVSVLFGDPSCVAAVRRRVSELVVRVKESFLASPIGVVPGPAEKAH